MKLLDSEIEELDFSPVEALDLKFVEESVSCGDDKKLVLWRLPD